MTNILSNVKSALRRGSNSEQKNDLSPEFSINHMNSFSSAGPPIVSRAQPSSSQETNNEITRTITSSSSSSSLDLRKQTSTTDEVGSSSKTKKQLKAEQKAKEDAEIAILAAKARERGENMKLDPMYLPHVFRDRGMAIQSIVPFK